MQEPADMELLRRYADQDSEEAFAALVHRHVNMVYSVALRTTNNPRASEEIAQAVFVILAQKARRLNRGTVLSGWLYQAARLTASNFLRGEIRRAHREQEAFMQSLSNETAPDLWPQIMPLLDDAMGRLRQKERDAIALRFFERKSFAEIAVTVGATENAAKKRVVHALEKLRHYFSKRGVKSTATAIEETISTYSVMVAPVGLAATISAVAVKGSATTASTLTLVKGALKLMAWTKAKTAVVVVASAIVVIGTTTIAVKAVNKSRSGRLESYFTVMSTTHLETAPPMVLLRPSRYTGQGDYVIAGNDLGPNGKLMRRGCSFTELLSTAYGVGREQMVLPANLPNGQFDMLLTVSDRPREALKQELRKQFGVVARPETRDADVLVLKSINPHAPDLKVSRGGGPAIWENRGSLKLQGYKISDPSGYDIAHVIGSFYNLPAIDETGLTDAYDIDVRWNANLRGNALRQEIQNVMRDRLGLEATPDRRSMEMVVVEKQNH